MLEYGSNRPDGILSDVSMPVFEAGSSRGKEGFDKFWLLEFAEESKGVSANVLVGMLKIIPYAITEESFSATQLIEPETARTTRESSPASTSHLHPASDRSRSRSRGAS